MDTSRKHIAGGKTVKLRGPTLDRLDALRHKGQSYDGVITELLDFWVERRVTTRTKGASPKKGHIYTGTL